MDDQNALATDPNRSSLLVSDAQAITHLAINSNINLSPKATKIAYDHIPLSYQQEQMLYLYHLDEEDSYNLPFIQEFDFPLDPKLLHKAFHILIKENSMLRTIFIEENYELFQRTLSLTESFYKFDIISIPYEGIHHEVTTLWKQKFDLQQSPSVRVKMYQTEKSYIVILILQHIISDARTTQIIEEELSRIYKTLKVGSKCNFTFDFEKTYQNWSINQKLENFDGKMDNFRRHYESLLEHRIFLKGIQVESLGTEFLEYGFEYRRQEVEEVCKKWNISPFALFCGGLCRSVINANIVEQHNDGCFFIGLWERGSARGGCARE